MKYKLNIKLNTGSVAPEMYQVIIYQIIRQCSNSNHKLSIDDIIDTFSDYWQGNKEIESYRKNIQRPVKRSLKWLMETDANIHAVKKDGTPYDIDAEESIFKIREIWYEQQLTSADIQLVTDAVISSKHFSNEQRRTILRNLLSAVGAAEATRAPWFERVLEDADDITVPVSVNLYKNLEDINSAINNRECLSFDFCFAKPRGGKCRVRSFTGVSPYKILHSDGTYYLVASRREELLSVNHRKNIDPKDIMTIEIHKLDNIRTDPDHVYFPMEKTKGRNMNVQSLLHSSYHPVRSHRSMFFLSNDNTAIMHVSAEGLDILTEKYGKRITAFKLDQENKNPDIEGISPDIRSLYKVVLRGVESKLPISRMEWTELSLLSIEHPEDIVIKEPDGVLDGVITTLEWTKNIQS